MAKIPLNCKACLAMYRPLHYLIVCCRFVSFSIFACELLLVRLYVITHSLSALAQYIHTHRTAHWFGPYARCVYAYCKRLLLFCISFGCVFFSLPIMPRFICVHVVAVVCFVFLFSGAEIFFFISACRSIISFVKTKFCLQTKNVLYFHLFWVLSGYCVFCVLIGLSVIDKNTYICSAMVFAMEPNDEMRKKLICTQPCWNNNETSYFFTSSFSLSLSSKIKFLLNLFIFCSLAKIKMESLHVLSTPKYSSNWLQPNKKLKWIRSKRKKIKISRQFFAYFGLAWFVCLFPNNCTCSSII